MELSQKELPIEKRFSFIVSHNKFLMSRNTLLEEELASHEALGKKFANLKWEYERLKEEKPKPVYTPKKKHKIAIQILKEHGLYQKYLNRTKE